MPDTTSDPKVTPIPANATPRAPILAPARRVRRTPFSEGVERAGVTAYSVYNRMLLPAAFRGPAEDYRHLKEAVQVWDVACERQVQLRGPDARRLLQLLTPRDLERLDATRCLYIPMVDQWGGMLNDPVALQVESDTFWISIADGDLRLWVQGIAAATGLEVEVTEPDVHPLAVQGPLADALMARVFGEGVAHLGFFRVGQFLALGREWRVARSGYSKQGGFEIYVDGAENGMPLWDALFAAGADLGVRAGCPNAIERIEGGLLSYGNDMTQDDTPLQCGLGKFVSEAMLDTCYGGRALREELDRGTAREVRAIEIEAPEAAALPTCDRAWPLTAGGQVVGQVTSAAWSPDFGTGVAIGMVARDHWAAGTALEVHTQDGTRPASVRAGFWN
ncbi:MAG: dimethylsulfoniopropionate demethylase [Shimia sp.]